MKAFRVFSGGRILQNLDIYSGDIRELTETLELEMGSSIHFASAHTITACISDDLLAAKLSKNIVVADSSYLARFLSLFDSRIQNIRGVDFFRSYLENRNPKVKNFFVAPDEQSSSRLKDYLSVHYQEITVAGVFVPSVNSDWRVLYSEIAREIQEKNVNVVWVSVGSPKQDNICAEISRELQIDSVAIGAAVKFLTGEVKEAPLVMRKFGLEWVHRIAQDPGRLGSRYIKDFFPFFLSLFLYAFSSKKSSSSKG